NYLGQFDEGRGVAGMWRMAGGATGSAEDEEARRTHLLEVGGAVRGGQLRLWIRFSRAIHHRATMERLLDDMLTTLRETLGEEPGLGTPEESGLGELEPQEWQSLLDRLVIHDNKTTTA